MQRWTITPWRRSRPPHSPVETLGHSRAASSLDVARLQEEANKALGCLLVTRSSIDAQWRKKVSDFGMALCQNKLETTEAFKELKAICAHTIQDVETHQKWCRGLAHHPYQRDWGWLCSHLSRGRELLLISHPWCRILRHFQCCPIQQSHAKVIQCLEAEAIEEEGRDCLAFLTICSAALRVNPPEACGIMVIPYHLLLGNAPMSALLSIPMGVSPPEQEPALQTPPSSAPAATGPSPQSKQQCNLTWLGGCSFPTYGYLQCGSSGATPLKVEGGNACP